MPRALISVSDKSGLAEFGKKLVENNYEIVSTGGTLKFLLDAGIPAIGVEDVTGFAECLDGRVKTLHPKIHAGILAIRSNPSHMATLEELGIDTIDIVAVNLYPFKATVQKQGSTFEEIIENIDIGGPGMLRAAAKNFESVAAICSPDSYDIVIKEIEEYGEVSHKTKLELAKKVFTETAYYDSMISNFLVEMTDSNLLLEEKITMAYDRKQELRYGENPHQNAAFFVDPFAKPGCLASMEQLGGKALSFNNIADANAALEVIKSFTSEPTCVSVKHQSPCSIASADDIATAYRKVYEADPVSIFGGIVAMNTVCDAGTADLMKDTFLEIVIAPEFTPEAIEILQKKQDLRILKIADIDFNSYGFKHRSVLGGLLVQSPDDVLYESLEVKTKAAPTDGQLADLVFAMKCSVHLKSNAIAIAKDKTLIGAGPGQTNRIGALQIAVSQASEKAKGAVLASDAFFPFDDCVIAANEAGIAAIIQPGGSNRDIDSITKCNELNIPMVFTSVRHFLH
ncbi:MAG: bifunctional phosphoribosylaminoimidazolecarboxamide formyltransferase/IMP cyclohydrolase [Eubacteriaceae bacterium]|nr:bifunctional phosphoribosylaminoimidazolecarboxamide formyltransferase/IMP cyclohydrolase [Eubacteriaceae bacterium]